VPSRRKWSEQAVKATACQSAIIPSSPGGRIQRRVGGGRGGGGRRRAPLRRLLLVAKRLLLFGGRLRLRRRRRLSLRKGGWRWASGDAACGRRGRRRCACTRINNSARVSENASLAGDRKAAAAFHQSLSKLPPLSSCGPRRAGRDLPRVALLLRGRLSLVSLALVSPARRENADVPENRADVNEARLNFLSVTQRYFGLRRRGPVARWCVMGEGRRGVTCLPSARVRKGFFPSERRARRGSPP